MTVGKGFFALAAIMIGDGNSIAVFLACLLFGYTSALYVTLQSVGLPSQIVLSVPYFITIFVLFVDYIYEKYHTVARKYL